MYNNESLSRAPESWGGSCNGKILRVLLISSILPDKMGLGSELTLERLLDHSCIEWQAIGQIGERLGLCQRILSRLSRTRFHALAAFLRPHPPLQLDLNEAEEFTRQVRPDVIVTVAQGWYYVLADKVSRRLRIPLVVLAHDWWPAKPEVPNQIRRWTARELRRICRQSSSVICVCEGMRVELGSPHSAVISHPIPSRGPSTNSVPTGSGPYRILYAGNLYEYGSMIESAALACAKSKMVRLEITGPKPWWSEGVEERLRADGIYHGLVSPTALGRIASSSHWMLAAMSFDPEMKQRMRTSFPSKIVEMAQHGKPLIIWGPEASSAVVWARAKQSALCITDPSPAALLEALERLAHDKSEQCRLSEAARLAALNEFNPDLIHDQFIAILRRVSNSGG